MNVKTITTAIIAASLLGACSTDEMIAQSRDECAKLGYKPGTQKYVECAERGFRTAKTTQEAAMVGTASAVLTGALLSTLY